jgi:hypothetical protein
MIFSHRYEYTYTDTHGRDPLGPWNGYGEGGAISGMAPHGKDEGLSMIIASEYIVNAFGHAMCMCCPTSIQPKPS